MENETNVETVENTNQNPATENQNPQTNEKTFTQEQVNGMLANEKRQGRNSVFNALGLNPDDKDALKTAKEILDSHKTEAQRNSEALETEKTARSEAETRALNAERRLSVLIAGCKAEFVDEVMALASVKVSDSMDFEAALTAVKEKCPSFFADSKEGDDGTGSGQGHKRTEKGDKPGSLGARLAQGKPKNTENPYFKN